MNITEHLTAKETHCNHDWHLYCDEVKKLNEVVVYDATGIDCITRDSKIVVNGRHITRTQHTKAYVCHRCGAYKSEIKIVEK